MPRAIICLVDYIGTSLLTTSTTPLRDVVSVPLPSRYVTLREAAAAQLYLDTQADNTWTPTHVRIRRIVGISE